MSSMWWCRLLEGWSHSLAAQINTQKQKPNIRVGPWSYHDVARLATGMHRIAWKAVEHNQFPYLGSSLRGAQARTHQPNTAGSGKTRKDDRGEEPKKKEKKRQGPARPYFLPVAKKRKGGSSKPGLGETRTLR